MQRSRSLSSEMVLYELLESEREGVREGEREREETVQGTFITTVSTQC